MRLRFRAIFPSPWQDEGSVQPREGPFHPPIAWAGRRTPGLIRTLDDFDHPVAMTAHRLPQPGSGIAAICEDMAQPRKAAADRLGNRGSAIAILYIGSVNEHEDQKSKRIGDNVALTALDLLACIVTANAATFRGLDALAVDDTRRGLRLTSLNVALPKPDPTPGMEVIAHRRNRREIARQHTPLAAARSYGEDRLHDATHVRRPRPTAVLCLGDQGRDQCPFPVRQIARKT